jgi:S-DNA-T family DNA segregation ATPase FtsK/SpoIIIE
MSSLKKINSFWLVWFSLFSTTISIVYYLIGFETIADNGLRITSQSEQINYVSFYFHTFVVASGRIIGPWLILFFVFFHFFCVKKTSTFTLKNKVIILLMFCTALLVGNYLFLPELAGDGPRFLLDQVPRSEYLYIFFALNIILLFFAFSEWSVAKLSSRYKHLTQVMLKLTRTVYILLHGAGLFLRKLIQNPSEKLFNFFSHRIRSKNRPSLGERVLNENELIDTSFSSKQTELSNERQTNGDNFDPGYENVGDQQEFISRIDSNETIETANPVKAVNKTKKTFKIDSDTLIDSISVSKKSNIAAGPDQEYFEDIIQNLEDKLGEFKINAKIINILKGPVVDTFELELGAGVKVSKVTGIMEDLSLALSGAPIRLVYPMKGKTTLGIEVPRSPREIIFLDEVLRSRAFKNHEAHLPLAMGKDAFGSVCVVDLAKMPHMLVAGATGAGKSVFVNTLLVSLLVKLRPDTLRLVLIDPKQLELALYADIPHLLMPVITEPSKAAASLLWACQEMERRYSILKECGVRNIESYNKKIAKGVESELAKVRPYFIGTQDFSLPYVVIIVDEFADLILTKSGKDIETNICRLAAKARAAGIHLILATQRPSVDVITGLIKSNFPTRVSFRVTSPTDSRTILNAMGAEKLLGMGDMLYKHGIETTRVHSAYVGEDEIENMIETLVDSPPDYDPEILQFIEEQEGNFGVSDEKPTVTIGGQQFQEDELLKEAIDIVAEHRTASASMLQRRLRIGYNRAANLIEMMEKNGIVGPQQGAKPRKVLIEASDIASFS